MWPRPMCLNGSRLSWGRHARGRKAWSGRHKGWPARQHNSSLLGAPVSFKRMLGARRRGIECRSTCDPEGGHIRPGSGRIDRVVENDILPLKLGVEENDSCYPMELVTGAKKAHAEARTSVRRQVDDKRVSTNLDPRSSRTHGVEGQFQRDMVGPSVPSDDSSCE